MKFCMNKAAISLIMAFELYAIQDERLRDVSSTDIPEKANYYVSYANAF